MIMKNIFSKILVAVALVAGPWALSSCSNEDNFWSEAVTISGTGVVHHEATIQIGQTLQLKAQKGVMIEGQGFAWESTNPAVATVNASGLVTAVKKGETVITATTTGGQVSYTGQITLHVGNMNLGFTDDQLDQSNAE